MQKCLSSFDRYIRSRSSKIIDLISLLSKSSLPTYTIVHTNYQNNIGILFQLLPKIQYYPNTITEYNPIIIIDEYANHTISLEELRYIDYSMSMKNKRYIGDAKQSTVNISQGTVRLFGIGGIRPKGSLPSLPNSYQILHSLPIVYPYDDSK
jgi:hypothetical protein